MTDENQEAWWRRTRLLALVTLGGAGLLFSALLIFASALDLGSFLGLPLGAFLTAVGLPVGLAVIVFRFAARQSEIDRRHGYSED
jgi:putative solute:sodium symporter small subunit